MQTSLAFQSTTFDVIDRNGQPWLRSSQIASALGYAQPERVIELHKRHADEFTDSITAVVTLPTPGGPQETRIFSLRGCHLLAMFARTSVAKAFRVWVLDVLETLNKAEARQRPALDTDTRLSKRSDPERQELTAMVNAWVNTSPIGYAAARSVINAHFGVKTVDEMTVAQVREAIALVRGRIAEQPLALPPAHPFPNAEEWETELLSLHEDFLRQSGKFEVWLGEMERRLRNVTGPMFIALTEDIARGTPLVSKERGRCVLHIGSRNALEHVKANLRDISTEIWYTTWFATAMKLRKAS